MSKCKKCCKEFKYQWCLDRHLRRKIPCKKQNNINNEMVNETVQNDEKVVQNDEKVVQNNEKGVHILQNDEKVVKSDEKVASADEKVIHNDNPLYVNQNKHNIYQCIFCLKVCSKKQNFNQHVGSCKEKDDAVRCLEIQLDLQYPDNILHKECRFCRKHYSEKKILTIHLKKCKKKQEYRKYLEAKLKEKTKHQPSTVTNNINNNQTTNNIGTVNVLNVSAETLRKFGEENTDHITNAYLRQMMGRLGVTIPKVVSNVAKKIYCDDSKPENQTIQITNVRSQWAKVSNGNDYELQALGDSVKGVRNKVTDLYVTRLCDDFEFFKKVTARIDRLDDLNNQNYTARTLEDKEDQKNASKLKGDIDREIKSSIYNVQKAGNIIKLQNSS